MVLKISDWMRVQGMIGLPRGLNVGQWLGNMKAEHCDVDPGNFESALWAASARAWTTGNYNIETTPELEWKWAMDLEWKGEKVTFTIGGYKKEAGKFTGLENIKLRRRAISIQRLNTEAPKRIHEMLTKIADQYGGAFTDQDGDGQIDVAYMLTEDEVRKIYTEANVNEAELLGLRLYTGPMFEHYNNVLRACGKEIPFGNRYPGLRGENTAGRFVTSIHAINSGIIKLSTLTPVITVYRGMSGLELPRDLEVANKFGGKLGIENSFMSTTTNQDVARHYGQDTWSGNNLGYVLSHLRGWLCFQLNSMSLSRYVLEFSLDSLNRGALLQWLSQYPGEQPRLWFYRQFVLSSRQVPLSYRMLSLRPA